MFKSEVIILQFELLTYFFFFFFEMLKVIFESKSWHNRLIIPDQIFKIRVNFLTDTLLKMLIQFLPFIFCVC